MTMKFEKIGIVAGAGVYPVLLAQAAKVQQMKTVSIAAIKGDAIPSLVNFADTFDWFYAGQIHKTIKFFQNNSIENVIFAGQIKPTKLFRGLRPDFRAIKLLAKLKARNAESIFSAVAQEFLKDGITVLPATTFLEDALAGTGVMGKIKPNKKQLADIKYGVDIARETSRLDIGQTVVVKKGTVLAVEAFEGTDQAIERGGELGRGSVTVVKIAKPNQDMRFDVPCMGLKTVETLIRANVGVVAIQTGKTLILEKEATIAALNKAKISIFGVPLD